LVGAGVLHAPPAGAATITLGPTLSSATVTSQLKCGNTKGCTVAQKTPSYTSPVTGMVVAWRVKGAAGTLTLRVIDGNTGGAGVAFGTALTTGKELFPAEIPIKAGERFGVDIANEVTAARLGYAAKAGAAFSEWGPVLAEGATKAPQEEVSGAELLLNVEIQPAPGITAVTPAAGPVEQPDAVTITGHDFEEVTGVEFGGRLEGFEVLSETTIAVEALGFTPGLVPVTVTTRAGSATLPGSFTFQPRSALTPPAMPTEPVIPPIDLQSGGSPAREFLCHVPKLKGKKLPAAKRKLTAAHCRLGKVTRARNAADGQGKVVGQVPAAGVSAPDGSRVKVHLG
jgi:hypothetical protein